MFERLLVIFAVDFLHLWIPEMVRLRVLGLNMDPSNSWGYLSSALGKLPRGTRLQQLHLRWMRRAVALSNAPSDPSSPAHLGSRMDHGALEILLSMLLEENFKELQVVDIWSDYDVDQWLEEIHYPGFALQLHQSMPELSSSGVLRVGHQPTKVCMSSLENLRE